METGVRNFYDLNAWKEARKLVRVIYTLSNAFPKAELFGLSNQMRRASVSVAANIAEGFGRSSIKEKLNFYNQSLGSLTELQSHVLLAKDLTFLTYRQSSEILIQILNVMRLLKGLMRSTKKRLPAPIS